jgi:hypothetical protein
MTELTTLYGDDIAYFWFDHHAGAAPWYQIDAIVRKNQPQCAMLGPDCWLTGQESGFAAYPIWYGVDTTDNTTHASSFSVLFGLPADRVCSSSFHSAHLEGGTQLVCLPIADRWELTTPSLSALYLTTLCRHNTTGMVDPLDPNLSLATHTASFSRCGRLTVPTTMGATLGFTAATLRSRCR